MKSTYALIMAVRDADKYLEETLESVFSQTLPASEIYVVDEFSTDRTLEIIRTFGSQITLMSNVVGGMAGAYNLAIPRVESDFIAFLDGDDLWLSTKSEKQIQFLNEHPDCDVVCCRVLNFTKASSDAGKYESTREFAPSRLFTASTFRRDTFKKFGMPDPETGHFGWLYDWWSRADDSGIRYGTIDEVLFHRRIHETNSWIRNRDLGNKTVIEIARRNIERRRND
jgi:glycosyltransferase involved in cell wall biosynthesis